MKNLKKLASLLLALVMCLTMTAVAFAEDAGIEPNAVTGTGSITVNGISADNTYEIYRLLVLESYDTAVGAYSYTVDPDWADFFDTADAKAYLTVDADGYVTWTGREAASAVAEFAKIALAYAEDNNIAPDKSSATPGDFTVDGTVGKFEGLELGYYLIDSTMGALCGLTTTNPNASINAKNSAPSIDKQVQEDSTNQWGAANTADIGQTVNYRVTINVHSGAQNYVLHDKMSAGLTFQKVSKIELIDPAGNNGAGLTTELTPDTDYTVVTEGLTDGCTFEVRFSKAFCDALKTNDKIIVHYEAMLNRYAVIGDEGNPNDARLEFGEDHYTSYDSTITRTYGIDLIKTDSQNTLIDGAEFKIYNQANGGTEVAVVLMEDGVTYRRARADETGVSIVVKDGKVRIVGLDNGTYYLEETVAPSGYNKLTERKAFTISDANKFATFNDDIYSVGSGFQIVNKSGTMLPETGGIGTTLFYVVGGILVAAAVVLLVTKKRMNER